MYTNLVSCRYKDVFPDDDVILGHKTRVGMLTGFASCVVQAHMQGSCFIVCIRVSIASFCIVYVIRTINFNVENCNLCTIVLANAVF